MCGEVGDLEVTERAMAPRLCVLVVSSIVCTLAFLTGSRTCLLSTPSLRTDKIHTRFSRLIEPAAGSLRTILDQIGKLTFEWCEKGRQNFSSRSKWKSALCCRNCDCSSEEIVGVFSHVMSDTGKVPAKIIQNKKSTEQAQKWPVFRYR